MKHPSRSNASDVFAVSGARLFDGEHILVDHAVLVKDGMVSGVVPCDSVPKGTTCHHEADCTILPGLIDTHVHFMRWQGPQFLAFGALWRQRNALWVCYWNETCRCWWEVTFPVV